MDNQQLDRIKNRLSQFLTQHRTEAQEIASKLSNIFEAFCYVLVVLHYEKEGLVAKAENLTPDNVFRFRFATGGHPWNFSYFSIKQSEDSNEILFEIRHNQKVAGHFVQDMPDSSEEPGLFALDIAVIKANALPDPPMGTKHIGQRVYVLNKDLITFGEAKKLVAYPMLLASFYGIVHELRPEFLETTITDDDSEQYSHPFPILFTSDFLTKGTKNVLKTFEDRQLRVTVVDNVNSSPEDKLLSRIKGIREEDLLSVTIENTINEVIQQPISFVKEKKSPSIIQKGI